MKRFKQDYVFVKADPRDLTCLSGNGGKVVSLDMDHIQVHWGAYLGETGAKQMRPHDNLN